MNREERHGRQTEILLLSAASIWAVNYPVAKFGLAGLHPFLFNATRYVVATVFLVLLFFALKYVWHPVAPKDRWKIVGVGVVGGVLYQIAFVIGLSLTTAGNSAVLLATSPLWTVLIDARVRHTRIPATMWGGIVMSLAGVVTIIIGSGVQLEFGSTALYGDLISMAAAATSGVNLNLQKPMLGRYPAMQWTLMMTAVGAVGLLLVTIPFTIQSEWLDVSWEYHGAAVVSGLFSIAVAGIFWSHGVQRFSPARVVVFTNLVPVIAFMISAALLDEEVHALQVLGAAITIAGVWVARR